MVLSDWWSHVDDWEQMDLQGTDQHSLSAVVRVHELGDAFDGTCIQEHRRRDDVDEIPQPAIQSAPAPGWHIDTIERRVDIDDVDRFADELAQRVSFPEPAAPQSPKRGCCFSAACSCSCSFGASFSMAMMA